MYNRFLSGEAAPVPSLTSLYPAADWYEREAYDLFGVLFAGHSDCGACYRNISGAGVFISSRVAPIGPMPGGVGCIHRPCARP
jgi:hypothetical protein